MFLKRCLGSVVIFGTSIAVAQTAGPALPDTAPAKIIGRWLSECQVPDLQKLRAFYSDVLSDNPSKRDAVENRAKFDLQECTESGGYRLVEIKESTPGEIRVLMVGNKTGMWLDQTIWTDPKGKLDRGRIMPADAPEASLPTDLSDANVIRQVRDSVDNLAKSGLFSGVVEVARGTKPLIIATGGYADSTKKTAITGSTQFTLGSMGKMFTAAAIGQLVDQKKVAFTDTVGKFFPEYPNETVRNKVTIGMLLSHTSGMGDFLAKRTPEMMKSGVKRASEFMPLYDKEEPKFEPGSKWAYSNAGLALVGAIVEKVSGEAYPDYIRKHIFAVAGMTNSDPNNIPHQDPKMVTPYTKMTDQGPAPDWHEAEHDIGSPAGGAISTADDLVKFADALRSGKLVSKETFQVMASPHGETPWGAKYGYAMEIADLYGEKVVGHGGGFPGVSTHLYIILDSPYTVVTLANQDPPSSERAGSKALALVTEKAKQGK